MSRAKTPIIGQSHHISVTRQALAQLPFRTSGAVGRKVLIRTDGAGGTHAFLEYLSARRLGGF
nr:hypothetical protein EU244_31250 [Rhodococcus qingshengii]